MSRTFRYMPSYATKMPPYQKNWLQLAKLGFMQHSIFGFYHDPRNEYIWGYDSNGRNSYHSCFPTRGWKEEYQGNTRRFYKRKVNKQKRRYGKYLCKEQN